MYSILIQRINILLARRHLHLHFAFVLRGLDGPKIGRSFVVAFRTPRDVVHVCELRYGRVSGGEMGGG